MNSLHSEMTTNSLSLEDRLDNACQPPFGEMSSLLGGILIGFSTVGIVLNLLAIRSMEKVILLFMLEQCISGLGDVSRLYFLKLIKHIFPMCIYI